MEKSNVAEPLPLRRDLMATYRASALFGWIVAGILLIVVIGLSVFIAIRPAPLKGVDESGRVVGQVIFDEPRLRGVNEILGDMKNLVRRCLTTSKQTVWDDIAICMSHLSQDLQDSMMTTFESTGELSRIAAIGCDRVDFVFSDSETGLTSVKRGDYFVEGIFTGSISCLDRPAEPGRIEFKMKMAATLVPKTEAKPLGIEVSQYEDI